jgi:hypothetical protein
VSDLPPLQPLEPPAASHRRDCPTVRSLPVVSIQIFLTNYERDFDDMNKAYVATMPNDVPFPVRTCVGVASLPKGTEIEMTIVSVGVRQAGHGADEQIAGKRHGGASL